VPRRQRHLCVSCQPPRSGHHRRVASGCRPSPLAERRLMWSPRWRRKRLANPEGTAACRVLGAGTAQEDRDGRTTVCCLGGEPRDGWSVSAQELPDPRGTIQPILHAGPASCGGMTPVPVTTRPETPAPAFGVTERGPGSRYGRRFPGIGPVFFELLSLPSPPPDPVSKTSQAVEKVPGLRLRDL
jgi:hypothetical protein